MIRTPLVSSVHIKHLIQYCPVSARDREWTLFDSKKKFAGGSRQGLTAPKPDWVAFYPVYDFDSEGGRVRIPTSRKWQWNESPMDSMVENFTVGTLKHLMLEHGLQPSTATVLGSGQHKASDLICFPWLIVEQKRNDVGQEKCYCQAANAGAAAVMLFERLCKYVPKSSRTKREAQIPPVVTVTTVDKMVRVWVAYSHQELKEYASGSKLHITPSSNFNQMLTTLNSG